MPIHPPDLRRVNVFQNADDEDLKPLRTRHRAPIEEESFSLTGDLAKRLRPDIRPGKIVQSNPSGQQVSCVR
jgi:hypothetical protein